MKVRVYYNLNRSVWSVQHYIPGKGWRVREHLDSLVLENVEFKVSEAGRQRVIRESRKNVHAYAIGELAARSTMPPLGVLVPADPTHPISYNPYKGPHFTDANGTPIQTCRMVSFTKGRKLLTYQKPGV